MKKREARIQAMQAQQAPFGRPAAAAAPGAPPGPIAAAAGHQAAAPPPAAAAAAATAAAAAPPAAPPPPYNAMRRPPAKKTLEQHVSEFLTGDCPKPKNLDNMPMTMECMRDVMQVGAWKHAASLADRMLRVHGTADMRLYYQLKLCRITALMKQRLYKEAEQVLVEMGQLPNEDEAIPFPLLLVQAELPHYLDDSRVAQNRLYAVQKALLDRMQRARTAAGVPDSQAADPTADESADATAELREQRLYLNRVKYSLANLFIVQEKYSLALEILTSMMPKGGAAERPELYCQILRIHLQIGGLADAAQVLQRMESEQADPESSRYVLFNHGLIAFARCDYKVAMRYFESVLQLERAALLRKRASAAAGGAPAPAPAAAAAAAAADAAGAAAAFDAPPPAAAAGGDPLDPLAAMAAAVSLDGGGDAVGAGAPSAVPIDIGAMALRSLEADEFGMVAAANNLSLCALYSCDLKRAVACLEDLIRQDPTNHVQEVVLFNLCTLYDLACDNPTSTTKKKVLQAIAARYHLDHINPASFRIPNQ
jgi:tetratricopeptide (TPR) repeat protein